MDGIIINELSLSGQFHDSQDFWRNGMPPFYKALQDARSFGVGYLFKQGSFYGAQATPDKTLHDLLTAPEARIIDEAKRYKSTLARAICNPFWDDAPQQDLNAHYLADEADVSGSSVAEATVRAVCLLSFIRSLYEKHPVVVTKDGVAIPVGNIWKEKQLSSILFERRGNCLLVSILQLVSAEENLISALLMALMDFPLLTMRTKTSLLIHSANLKNWIGMP